MMEGTYIVFVPVPHHGKTRRWSVEAKKNHDELGLIQWYGTWRKYAFCPYGNRVFEEICLREIAEFIEARTLDHKSAKMEKSA